MPTTPPTVSFDTTLTAFGNNTGIVVPPGVIESLGAGKRPPVDVHLNNYVYRTTVGSMKGQSMISVSAAIRAETGLAAGDPVLVTLAVNDTARDVTIPDDFASALRDNDGTETFFAGLSNSLQRYHVDQITGAKTEDTRQRRIDKAISLFLDGKKR
jgi:hypothetical protein